MLPDRLRPLNARGERDAPLVGRHLQEAHGFSPGLMVSSPAVRAITTARAIAQETGYAVADIRLA